MTGRRAEVAKNFEFLCLHLILSSVDHRYRTARYNIIVCIQQHHSTMLAKDDVVQLIVVHLFVCHNLMICVVVLVNVHCTGLSGAIGSKCSGAFWSHNRWSESCWAVVMVRHHDWRSINNWCAILRLCL